MCTPVLPQKVEKKHPNSFYILYLDRKRKKQHWKNLLFLCKIWWFLLTEKFFTPWKCENVKNINFSYLVKNGMRTISFSKKFGFIAQNFDFYPLKTFFYPLNTCQCKLKSVSYFTVGNYNNRLKIALKLAFTKIGFCSLKLQFYPLKPYYWNGSKNFQYGKFCWIEVAYNVLCVL